MSPSPLMPRLKRCRDFIQSRAIISHKHYSHPDNQGALVHVHGHGRGCVRAHAGTIDLRSRPPLWVMKLHSGASQADTLTVKITCSLQEH